MRTIKIGIVIIFVVAATVGTATAVASTGASDEAEVLPAPTMDIVGEDIYETHASPNPYSGVTEQAGPQLIWSDVLHYPGANYICPHFDRMDLGPGDFVVVRSPDGSREWTYTGTGIDRGGVGPDGFWGIHISGETAIVELWSVGKTGGFGYVIDRFARGYSRQEFESLNGIESIIGTDDSEWAPCYASTNPEIYQQSRAVARMLVNGSGLCTGWLVGNEGHFITNNHCIANQAEASNTNYEFMAEGATCATNCWQLWCPGDIVTTSGTLIKTSHDYDYSLVELSVNPAPTYGHFTLRETGAVVGERLYIPQHPAGWGKRIALYSSQPADPGYPYVVSKNYGGCNGRPGPDMGYRADTQGGSSGSPVVSYDDNKVIGLHHCGGSSSNSGVLIEQVIAHLGDDLPATAYGVQLIFEDDFESGDTQSWGNISP